MTRIASNDVVSRIRRCDGGSSGSGIAVGRGRQERPYRGRDEGGGRTFGGRWRRGGGEARVWKGWRSKDAAGRMGKSYV